MKGNITKTVKKVNIRGLFYNRESGTVEEKDAYVYTGVGEDFNTADVVAQNPGLIEVINVGESTDVTVGMTLDRFFNFREFEKEKANKKD